MILIIVIYCKNIPSAVLLRVLDLGKGEIISFAVFDTVRYFYTLNSYFFYYWQNINAEWD